MAQVLTKSGRYATVETVAEWRKFAVWMAVLVLSIAVLQSWAWIITWAGKHAPGWVNGISLVLLAIGTWRLWARRRLPAETASRQDPAAMKSLRDEEAVAIQLNGFPDSFRLIHGFQSAHGSFDHVVIGPTGVFLLETKTWRGTVTADRAGELLCNGKPLERPEIREFQARVIETRTRLHAELGDLEPYLQGVFVFTAAQVEAPLGTTRTIHCLRDEHLWPYMGRVRRGYQLEPDQIERIALAFLGLARRGRRSDSHSCEPNEEIPLARSAVLPG